MISIDYDPSTHMTKVSCRDCDDFLIVITKRSLIENTGMKRQVSYAIDRHSIFHGSNEPQGDTVVMNLLNQGPHYRRTDWKQKFGEPEYEFDRKTARDAIDWLQHVAHSMARESGWHDRPTTFGDRIALVHSELSEALEEFRKGNEAELQYTGTDGKPEGVPSELADVVIRVFDMAGLYGIDLGAVIDQKMAYNATRSLRHGGKAL